MTKQELREIREKAIQVLYVVDLLNEDLEDIYRKQDIFSPEIRQLVNGVISRQEEIDIIIENNLEKYTLKRLGYIDRAILRVATYEMLNNLHPRIAINEALEISKKYTQTDDYNSAAFNNKILDKISKDIESGRE
jgi:N utilization substance protein B